MAENQTNKQKTPQEPATQTNGHSAENTGTFRLQSQYIKDLSFECPQPPVHLGDYKNNMQLDVGVESKPLTAQKQDTGDDNSGENSGGNGGAQTHEVTLILRGHNTTEQDKTVYFLEMKYSGLFTLQDIPDEHVRGLLGVEAPALLYPFARQLFMSTVSSSGFQPPLLEPINFAAMYMQQHQKTQQTQH